MTEAEDVVVVGSKLETVEQAEAGKLAKLMPAHIVVGGPMAYIVVGEPMAHIVVGVADE